MESSGQDGIRLMVEMPMKFHQTRIRRGINIKEIILDPPAYGNADSEGKDGFLEEQINEMLKSMCFEILDQKIISS